MAKLIISITVLMLIVISIVDSAAIAKDPKSVSGWFEKLSLQEEKITKLHFYFHDIVSGKNPTSVMVARANRTNSSPISFGSVAVIDDLLTARPDPNSPVVGRAQGLFAHATVTGENALLMTVNLIFTSGKYNGSTLSLLGRNPIFNKYREMPIIGGSGVFRLARGIATAHTVYLNLTTGDAIVEYRVIFIHY